MIQAERGSTAQFVLPVVLENILTTAIGLYFSYYVGQISVSALSTTGLGNSAVALLTSAATMLATGSSILCARLIGEGNYEETSRIIEQTILLTVLSSLAMTALCIAFAGPIMQLLMPGVDADVFAEGLSFFRVLLLSLPFLLMNNALTGILRASGDGRSPMIVAVLVNLTQLLFAALFIRWLRLEAVGVGLTYLFSRICGTALAFSIVLCSRHKFRVRISNLVRPQLAAFSRILHIGLPTSVESIFVQMGYLIANSMVLGLGTFQAAVFNVANTLYGFAAVPQSICATVAMPIAGHLIGACQFDQAKKTGWKIWRIGMGWSFLLSGLMIAGGTAFCGVYTSDPDVLHASVQMLWPAFFMCIPAISLNTLDPQLRVGGDVKYVMYITVIAVWAIRLPLMWLMCYRLGMGAAGVFWANTISLSFRAVFNMARFVRGKYLRMCV